MVYVSFCVICIVERLVSSVICRFQGLSYLHVPDCIRVFFYFVNSSHYSSYFDFCTKCNILDINLLWNMNFVDHLLFYMKLLNYLFCDMFGSVLECYELTLISWLYTPGNHAWVSRHCYPIGCVIKTPIRAYVHRPPKVWHHLEHRRHARVLIPTLEYLLSMIITNWDYSVIISS